jgi:outer membrane autotransporter protein
MSRFPIFAAGFLVCIFDCVGALTPVSQGNAKAVEENLNTLVLQGQASPDLLAVIASLGGKSVAITTEALDQMHPAAFSAFAEVQAELGGQLLSLFHRRMALVCSCSGANRFWVEPYGNWLKEKNQGIQIGFRARTRGVAIGYDHQFFGCWTIGIGGAYQATDLKWTSDRGYAYEKGAYGSVYTDLSISNFYVGASAYAGRDWYEAIRKIDFTTVDRQAKSNFHGLDGGVQLTSAYFFGTPVCLLYPYATVDYLYLKNHSFTEGGAASLDLNVDSYGSSNLRVESGGAFRFVDRNADETICISPLISIGYVLELPLHRDRYQATFSGESLVFTTRGWNQAWQLFNIRFGLGITYRCFTLDSQYSADMSTEKDSPFFNQRANFRFNFSF